MAYQPLPPDVLRAGFPTLFALRDKSGCLLVPKGTMMDADQLEQLAARDLYVDDQDGEALRRAIAGKVHELVRNDELLGRIAQARPDSLELAAPSAAGRRRLDDAPTDWSNLQVRLAALLRDAAQPDFAGRLMQLQKTMFDQINSDADDALLLLVHGATQEYRDYSASHALLVAVVAELASRHVPGITPAQRQSLRCAALTMNVAMTALQNQLAQQSSPLSAPQRAEVDSHPARAVAALRAAGVDDALWLEAVLHHHDAPGGPLAGMEPAQRLARLIRRADVFAARMSPRRGRQALSATAAAKAAYLDEQGKPDEAGSAIIKAVGLYPPGSLVKLADGETAVVLRRGRRANAPTVACIVNPAGAVLASPALRQTHMPAHAVTGGVAPHEVKVRLNLQRLLQMT
ncbi:HD-GYP domain-containing protein [Piscinibacter sp.]|uniref:HD-GYP domain-containing protein n=1 Tax=Piscinibacter sp. TaxID=1903157 RepID=UPI0035B1E103